VLHDQKQATRRLDDFVELNNVRVPHYLQDVNFAAHSLHIVHLANFIFFQNLNGHLLVREKMDALLHLSERSLAQSLRHAVTSNHEGLPSSRFKLDLRLVR
jgi:hypothetical protein